MPKKLMLLINPYSGRGLSRTAIGDMVTRFAASDYVTTVFFTRDRNTTFLAEKYGGEFDTVVCAGGDGTLSDVVTGLMSIENPPPIGYIPSGTANDMATTLALSRDIPTAVATILEGETIALDVGSYDNKFFTYIAAFGAFTSVSYGMPQNAKRALGNLAYFLGGLADLAAIKPRHTIVEYDGGIIEDDLVFGGVTNSTSIAGLVRLNSDDVDLGDGKFEVILMRNPVTVQDFLSILSSVARSSADTDNVRMLHTSHVKFTFDEPVSWTRDGENAGEYTQIEIQNRARAMRVIIPRKVQDDEQPELNEESE